MKRIPFIFAFLLPPQVQDLSWTWEKQGRDLKSLSAKSLSTVSSVAFFHRFFEWTSDGSIRYPDASSGEWFQINPLTSQTSSLKKSWKADELADPSLIYPRTLSLAGLRFRMSENGRRIELLDPQNPNSNAWLLDLPTKADVVEWTSDEHDFLVGLARSTREFFVLNPRSMRAIKHVQWDPSVEISELVSCPGREQLLVEQPRAKPVTRVVRMRDWSPTTFTVFDLSQGKLRSDLSKTLTRNCREIFFAGPYGLQRVQY
ncbi:MAG: hypothetical protein ABIR96_09395 [Bdellovibrionota bacterium]